MSNNIPEGVELPKGVKIGEYETENVPIDFTYAKPESKETEHEQN